MRSTGPIIAVGAITLVNQSVVNGEPINWRLPIATGIAAGGLALVEHLQEDIAVGIAWTALVAVLFVRLKPDVPAPTESFLKWWNGEK